MGFLWDLVQQSQIHTQQEHNASLDQRVGVLEDELRRTQELLRTLITRLEEHVRVDLNSDGRVG
jgi:Tfp pilus assembly protein PilN